MVIRKLTSKDYEQAEALFHKLHNIHVAALPDMFKERDLIYRKRDFKKLIKSKDKILLCAEEKGRIIAVSNTKLCTSGMTEMKMAFMDAIYVEEGYRKNGVGKQLFSETERLAKEWGAKRLDLSVWSFNKTALGFYEALGMQIQNYTLEKVL